MRTVLDTLTINRYLGKKGLATLDNPQGLVTQLGFCIQDHDQFRSLLTRCEPEHRRDMYESLKPHLRFEAKPLDVYLGEAGQRAQALQLPTVDAEGKLQPFRDVEVHSDEYLAQQAVNQQLAKYHLVVTCRSCTLQEGFFGDTKMDAIVNARLAGWVYYERDGQPQVICPECPAIRKVS